MNDAKTLQKVGQCKENKDLKAKLQLKFEEFERLQGRIEDLNTLEQLEGNVKIFSNK
jgi:hypothetical protein